MATTLYDKLWESHVVVPESAEAPALLYVDLHLVHEVTSPQAFALLRERGLGVRRPERTLATLDHSVPTRAPDARGRLPWVSAEAEAQVAALEASCAEHGIRLEGLGSRERGIVHVIGPELGATQPGTTIVCGDSHTSTHGAFGALAFGIGTTEVLHVLATQCLLQRKSRSLALEIDGELRRGSTAKDLALLVLAELGAGGGTGHVLEYRGAAVRALSMEGRMTLCNMTIESGARTGLVAPDETTLRYLEGRPCAPRGAAWDEASRRWSALRSDPGATFDRTMRLDAADVTPRVTFGTRPAENAEVTGCVPAGEDPELARSLRAMGLAPGQRLAGHPIDEVFLGSCTNGRIEDLRAAASLLRGRRVARGLRALVVPGSERVREQAETEGLADVFREAGCEWRASGCSMCIAMNGDRGEPGRSVVSTSNRSFAGRQGPGVRTFLASPLTAAATALAGALTDPRELLD